MADVLWDEKKDKKNGTTKKRRINLELLATYVWSSLKFLFGDRRVKTRVNALVQCVFGPLLRDHADYFHGPIVKEIRKFMRREYYKPWMIVRDIDTSPVGSFNQGSCETIRSLEQLKKNEQGCFPSGQTVGNYARKLEAHCRDKLGLDIKETTSDFGVSYKFDFDILLRLIIEGYGMVDVAKAGSRERPMLIAPTLDGAKLTNELGHVTGGIKIVDPRCINPLTGTPIVNFQSRDLCYVFQLTFGKDCTGVYDVCYDEFFKYFGGSVVVPSTVDGKPELSNIEVVSPADMSAGWKITGKGGATSDLFCIGCMCHQCEKHRFKCGDDRCDDCTRLNCDHCFCHPVTDGEHLEGLRELVQAYFDEAMVEHYERHDAIKKDSIIEIDPTVVNKENIPTHIAFEPATKVQKKAFIKLINNELRLRLQHDQDKLDDALAMESLKDRTDLLLRMCKAEAELDVARETLTREEHAKQITSEQAIPCTLHLVMRVSEKVFWSLLSQGIDRYQDGDGKIRTAMVKAVAQHMCKVVLDKTQWTFPLVAKDGGGVVVAPRNMTGAHSKKCISGMHSLVAVVFSQPFDESDRDKRAVRRRNAALEKKWHAMMDTFVPMMATLDQKEDFTDAQIDALHVLTNTFMDQYVDLFSGEGITNYIHVLGAGHLTYYLRRYRNLYRFNQQGWEALNQLFHQYYFHNTNHGGCNGNSNGAMIKGLHCLPLMRLCLRRTAWLLGHGEPFFEALEDGPDDKGSNDSDDDDEDDASTNGLDDMWGQI